MVVVVGVQVADDSGGQDDVARLAVLESGQLVVHTAPPQEV